MKTKSEQMAKTIQKQGALRKALHAERGKKIPAAKLEEAAKGRGITAKRANLAITLLQMRNG